MYLEVELEPLMSTVWFAGSLSTLKIADSNLSANEGHCRCRNIIAVDRSMAVGLARFLPTKDLATCLAPCSKMAIDGSLPTFAPGHIPAPPTRPAQRLETRLPYKLGVTRTSKCSGVETSFMHVASTIISSNSMFG